MKPSSSKWAYIGTGIALVIILIGISVLYVIKKRRDAKLASDNIKFV